MHISRCFDAYFIQQLGLNGRKNVLVTLENFTRILASWRKPRIEKALKMR